MTKAEAQKAYRDAKDKYSQLTQGFSAFSTSPQDIASAWEKLVAAKKVLDSIKG